MKSFSSYQISQLFACLLVIVAPVCSFAQSDACGSAVLLTSSSTCSNTVGNVAGSTYPGAGNPPLACGTPKYDVWYKFVAQTVNPTITLSSIGAGIATPKMQLYSGACGAMTSLNCNGVVAGVITINASGLTMGSTYYIRIFSTTGVVPSFATGGFSICITDVPTKVNYSKSYINVSKGNTGGTVDPGDTLEIRVTFDLEKQSVDSLAFYDTLFHTRGFKYVPNSLALRTNEGIIYKSYTDLISDTDPGWVTPSGLDTVIHMNFGTGATNTRRGKLFYNSKPSVYNNTCIVMATYRVVVYAPYNTKISFKTGQLTYEDLYTNTLNNIGFAPDSLIVYSSPGLCPNAVSATNAIGVESNGTFGTPSNPAPLARNRGTSAFTNYIYATFNPAGGPQDYYYGITNNTSAVFSTSQILPKPDGTNSRVFQLWDIIGDHTNSTNTARGNLPCDTTLPVSASNPCGYMLVINSAYKADTAFQYTATNLCPNTYYEISAWFRNICYKCSCDSNGNGATNLAYQPAVAGDSSGVQPNLAFDVNGTDYYTTGNLKYLGTTPTGSDTTNSWVKKGFTYLTGVSQTSFTLTIRNNAPGGGGNDWVMDDISIATCLPNMQYSPSLNPTVCKNNTITINDTISSYFNNYQNYKWQRSTDNGATFTDIAGATGTATPSLVGSNWQYITSYTIPPGNTNQSDSGNQYRVVVATTTSNLSNANCEVTDGVSIIHLKVINCGIPLATRMLTFNGKLVNNFANLYWATTNESAPVYYNIEKSSDGNNFTFIARVRGHQSLITNYYSFIDSTLLSGKVWYRIAVVNASNNINYSRIIELIDQQDTFLVSNVINPFSNSLIFNVFVRQDSKLEATLLNLSGSVVLKQSLLAYAGDNSLMMPKTDVLSSGVYILQLRYKDKLIIKKVSKE